MIIEIRLFANLRKYLPAGATGGSTKMELPDGATLGDLIEKLAIPSPLAQLVMVDGQHEQRRERVLADGQVVSIFPPVAGG
jgi:molybdopterin converting factor small subunit